MSNIPAPIKFTEIGLERERFKKQDTKSWRGPCPACGGTRRYVIFTNNTFPLWFGMCDECGRREKYWEKSRRPIAIHDRQAAVEATIKAEEERKIYRRQKLAEFSTSELWEELHERMTIENYAWWEGRGIPKSWADFWKLGYTPEKLFEHEGQTFRRAAYTIPKFDLGWIPTNIDFRLVDPPDGVGKYRPKAGLAPSPFFSRPDQSILPEIGYIVEGSIKAACVSIYADETALQVIGVPSCNSWAGAPERVKNVCGRVYIVLDPGTEIWARRMAQEIGPAARIVTMPVKPDDAFVLHGMTHCEWKNALRQAVRL